VDAFRPPRGPGINVASSRPKPPRSLRVPTGCKGAGRPKRRRRAWAALGLRDHGPRLVASGPRMVGKSFCNPSYRRDTFRVRGARRQRAPAKVTRRLLATQHRSSSRSRREEPGAAARPAGARGDGAAGWPRLTGPGGEGPGQRQSVAKREKRKQEGRETGTTGLAAPRARGGPVWESRGRPAPTHGWGAARRASTAAAQGDGSTATAVQGGLGPPSRCQGRARQRAAAQARVRGGCGPAARRGRRQRARPPAKMAPVGQGGLQQRGDRAGRGSRRSPAMAGARAAAAATAAAGRRRQGWGGGGLTSSRR
jgi:hypothetical protein